MKKGIPISKSASTVAAILFAIGCVCFPPDASARVWTSVDGRTLDAEFVRMDGDAVVVVLGGKTIPIPLSSLSASDQEWARSQNVPQPAQVQLSMEKPKLLVQYPGDIGTLTRIDVSVPVGYSGPPLTVMGPDGKEHTLKVLDAAKLPTYLSAVNEMNEAVKGLSPNEAKANKDKIMGLFHKATRASVEVGIRDLCKAAYFTTTVMKGSRRDDRSGDEKRSDPLAGPDMVAMLVESDDKDSWREAIDLIGECLFMLRKLKPDDRFVYTVVNFDPELRPEDMAQFGVWRLIAEGTELDTVKAVLREKN